jgi:hypothetical protein
VRATTAWYVFIHQLPPRPLYLRARVRNLLSRTGAIPLKDSVYVLPLRGKLLPGLREIANIAMGGGGQAYVCEGTFLERPSRKELVAAFRRARDLDYRKLLDEVRQWVMPAATPPDPRLRLRARRARRRLEQITRIDFFGAPARVEIESALAAFEARVKAPVEAARLSPALRDLIGHTWVTRRGIQIDRIASAWLIRRFIDPKARFRFVDPHEDPPRPDELRFDVVGGDFTHEDDRCTFEALVRRAGLKNAALASVAEIVHDIDIKDAKFERPEAPGVERLLQGILATHAEDDERLARGFALLDDLYGSFRKGSATKR